jgi:hypothetical protein
MEDRAGLSPRVVLSGIDTAEGTSNQEIAPKLAMGLPHWKRQAGERDRPIAITLGGEAFEVLPKGNSSYPFWLNHDRGMLMLQPNPGRSRRPTVAVKMGAKALHDPEGLPGELGFWEKTVLPDLLGLHALDVAPLQSSRVDVHADATVPVSRADADSFVGYFERRHPGPYTDAFESIAFGSRGNPVYARVYDRLGKCQSTGDAAYLPELWAENGWTDGEPVSRAEIEFRRDALVEFDMRTLWDVVARQGELWRYGVEKWIRLTIPGTATRRENWKCDPRWIVYQHSPLGVGVPVGKRNRASRHTPQLAKLLPGFTGYLTTMAALLGIDDPATAGRQLMLLAMAAADDQGRPLDERIADKAIKLGGPDASEALRKFARFVSPDEFEPGPA